MKTINIRPYLERLRTSSYDFAVHVLDDPSSDSVIGGRRDHLHAGGVAAALDSAERRRRRSAAPA